MLLAMQPFYELTLSRPWHWGIAIISAVGAEVPENLGEETVTSAPGSLVIMVRHAQDVDADSEVILTDLADQTRVRLTADEISEYGVASVRIDLAQE
jgi:hypothetical protein